MANSDTPMGFVPYRHLGGGVIRAAQGYKLDGGYATDLFRGDAVVLTSGYIARAADNSATILGIVKGFKYRASDGSIVITDRWIASTATLGDEDVEVEVYTDPMISYKCQSDTGTAYVDATHKGGVFDVELDHAGSTVTGQSGMELDLNDTGTGQFLVVGLIDEPNNAAGVNAKLEVLIKESALKVN
jgi:hypothetical protein